MSVLAQYQSCRCGTTPTLFTVFKADRKQQVFFFACKSCGVQSYYHPTSEAAEQEWNEISAPTAFFPEVLPAGKSYPKTN